MSTSGSQGTTQTVYIVIPDGPRVRGASVRKFLDMPVPEHNPHPNRRHRWHHQLHYGRMGTGFAECYCGAMGVVYERKRAS